MHAGRDRNEIRQVVCPLVALTAKCICASKCTQGHVGSRPSSKSPAIKTNQLFSGFSQAVLTTRKAGMARSRQIRKAGKQTCPSIPNIGESEIGKPFFLGVEIGWSCGTVFCSGTQFFDETLWLFFRVSWNLRTYVPLKVSWDVVDQVCRPYADRLRRR